MIRIHSNSSLSPRPTRRNDSLQAGSTITCANIKSHIDFKALLEGSGIGFVPTTGDGSLSSFESSWQISEPGYHGVIISHFCGNPTKTVEMAPLLETKTFNVAICLGSVVGAHLGSSAMDSRVLSMLLILRKLTKVTPRCIEQRMRACAHRSARAGVQVAAS